jgi:RNA polymerase sigma factor (sigma-70 family)
MPGTKGMEALAKALAASRDAAFPRLVRSLQDGVYSGALRLLGSRADAEDVTQETFIRAYRALGTYPREQVETLRLRAWVWTIAANLCRNRARTRRRRPQEPLDDRPGPAEPSPGPEEEVVSQSEQARLAAHLARLPWSRRAAVVLHHVNGMPYTEIADALGRPLGTVKADVHRGLQQLRRILEEEA